MRILQAPSHQLTSAAAPICGRFQFPFPISHTNKITPEVTQEQPSTHLYQNRKKEVAVASPTSLFLSSTEGLLLSPGVGGGEVGCRQTRPRHHSGRLEHPADRSEGLPASPFAAACRTNRHIPSPYTVRKKSLNMRHVHVHEDQQGTK